MLVYLVTDFGCILAYKPFNKEMFDKCDPPAREAVTKWIKVFWGLEATDNPDKYGVDLVLYKNGRLVAYVEVEQRDWGVGAPYCPYPTIHVAHRKKKLFANKLPTLLFVCTTPLVNAYWVKTEIVETSPLIEVKNRAVKEDEWFYDVDIGHFNFVDLTQPF